MQIGTENRNKTIAAISLTALALLLVLWRLFPSSPSPSAATPSAAPAAASPPLSRRSSANKKYASEPRSLDPTLRFDWLRASEDTKYQGTGRNIFKAKAEIPVPIAPVVTDKVAPPVPQGPPPPPPILLKFYGFASKPGEPRKVFLSQGDDVFIAGEGDIVNRRYRVVRITPVSVEIEDVLSNNRQSIPLSPG